jgi:predicted nucleic acid-binding protein
MATIDILLDTNVLVAALRSQRGASNRIIRLIVAGDLRMNISVALALEYEAVLKREGMTPGMTGAGIDRFLD